MRQKYSIGFIVMLLMLAMSIPALAQDDATCVRVVAEAFKEASANCANTAADSVCYGSGMVQAVPRYLTSDFAFDDVATTLEISRIESVATSPLNITDEDYGVATLSLTAGVEGVLFGNALVTNNVVPTIELALTVNTIVPIQAEPVGLSETVGTLLMGDTVTADGRVGDALEVDDSTWVRVRSDIGAGWVPASSITEDYLVPSLSMVDPAEPVQTPLQHMTLISGGSDRGCATVTDSGLLLQTDTEAAALHINTAQIDIAPMSAVFVQAQPNTALDVYVLEGAANVTVNELTQVANGGQVVSVPIDINGAANSAPNAPVTYINNKVMPLVTVAAILPRTVAITPGGEGNMTASTEVVMPDGETAVAEPVAPVESSPTMIEAAPAEAVATGLSDYAASIQTRGTVRVGVSGVLPTFSFEENGSYSGFEIDFARALVDEIFGAGFPIEYVSVSARQRDRVLSDGSVDMLVRNSSFTPQNAAWGEWTNTFYFIDGQRLLVRADSGINGFTDLAGRNVLVQAGSSAEAALNAAGTGANVQAQQGILLELFTQLETGAVDALSENWTTLESLRTSAADPNAYVIVGDPLTNTPWQVVVPVGQAAFRDEVDTAMVSVLSSGQWLNIYGMWFNQPLPASQELFFQPTGDMPAMAEEAPVVAEEVAAAPTEEVAEAPVVAEEVAAAPTEEVAEAPVQEQAAPPAIESSVPLTGDVSVAIFTPQTQQRTIVITPDVDDTFLLELVRGGEIVYSARYAYYESSGRWENTLNSFEYVTFSDTAGQEELGCNREPDIKGFFNGADFEGRKGC